MVPGLALTGAAGSDSSSGSVAAGVLVLIVVSAGFYFLPSIVAGVRHVPNFGSVLVVNIFLGWTLIGWVVAMAMAARSVDRTPRGYAGHPPPPPGPGGQWFPDPSTRNQYRWWDGAKWTDAVMNQGVRSTDPPVR